jgi:chromosome segregation ATPase
MPTDRNLNKLAPANAGGDDGGRQEIDDLRRRYERLRERRITAEADLRNATQELERLQREAKAAYGTDDLDELTRLLGEMRRENERKRAEYQQHLDAVEARLAEVEAQFARAKEPGAK